MHSLRVMAISLLGRRRPAAGLSAGGCRVRGDREAARGVPPRGRRPALHAARAASRRALRRHAQVKPFTRAAYYVWARYGARVLPHHHAARPAPQTRSATGR